MCWKKIKKWKLWNWRFFQWIKAAFNWVKWLFTHRITKKICSRIVGFFNNIALVVLIIGLIFALGSGIYYGNRPDYSIQQDNLALDLNDYFLVTYNLVTGDIWDIKLNIGTPNADFRVYIIENDLITFTGDIPQTIYGYYPVHHESYWHLRYDIPNNDTWSCLIVNYNTVSAQFDLESEIVTTARWIDFIYNSVKTISDYWLIPIFTLASLVYIFRELNKTSKENAQSTNNQTSNNNP